MTNWTRLILLVVAAALLAACESSSSPAASDSGGADDVGVAGDVADAAPAEDAAMPVDTPSGAPDAAADAATDAAATGACETDDDCPGCLLCARPQDGPAACVDPTADGTEACATRLDCPEHFCCSYTPFDAKPTCGGLCVADDGAAECSGCTGEGMQVSGESERCCPGLTAIPADMSYGGDRCFPSRCFCMVCVRRCGDGLCTAGEDPCSCPEDCPVRFEGGPGDACTLDEDCTSADAACLPAASGYPTGGYCTGGVCDPASQTDLCPVGSVCTGTDFSQAYLCLPTCRRDADCHTGLTCEAFPEQAPSDGGYFCWESGLGRENSVLGNGLGEPCAAGDDCISRLCLAHPESGDEVCAAFCDADTPCKEGQTCHPMGGCAGPGCGACF